MLYMSTSEEESVSPYQASFMELSHHTAGYWLPGVREEMKHFPQCIASNEIFCMYRVSCCAIAMKYRPKLQDWNDFVH